jgi:ribosomal protein L20
LLNKNSSGLNRKVLSDLCVNDPESFRKLVDSLKN